jgi:Permuted papain-like amidase enzyme, YaeF/YiiX, C92 family
MRSRTNTRASESNRTNGFIDHRTVASSVQRFPGSTFQLQRPRRGIFWRDVAFYTVTTGSRIQRVTTLLGFFMVATACTGTDLSTRATRSRPPFRHQQEHAENHASRSVGKKILLPVIPLDLRDGDVIFQSTEGASSEAIRLATHSAFSHVGVVVTDKSSVFVFEAVGPVKATEVHEWILRDPGEHYTVKRLRGGATRLTPAMLQKMREVGAHYQGRPYDPDFDWSDEKLYCSELVWKIYHAGAGIDLGAPKPMRTFDLQHPLVQRALRERYGVNVPLNEPMISPEQLADSPELELFFSQ